MNIAKLKERYPKAFDEAYRHWREGEGDLECDWYDASIESAVEDAKERGFRITYRRNEKERAAFYFSGFWSQGDGASWEGEIDLPMWVEWMKAERDRKLDVGPQQDDLGNGTPFSDTQLLWLDEAWHNDVLGYRLVVNTRGNGNYSHSGCMQLADSLECTFGYEHHVREGIFAGMDVDVFAEQFRALFPHEEIEDAALAAARDFADHWYDILEKEFEYLTSEEYFIERMQDDARDFDENGNEAGA